MIPGQTEHYSTDDFRAGIRCGVVGCGRRARHEWAYPCAIRTMSMEPAVPAWLPVCDECDLRLNRVLLREVGVPEAVLEDLLQAYALIQADGAFDLPETQEDRNDQ